MPSLPTGRCHCGAVTVEVPPSSFGVLACHCDDCQRLHGNFFAFVAAPAADVVWTGEEHIRWYDSSPAARRSFCERCGSRLAKRPVGSDRVLVSVGLFGPDTGLRIAKELYADRKPDWYAHP
jgi:hypothetical protein